jgi:hypothetical protein
MNNLSDEFDEEIYKLMYDDVKYMSKEQILYHYINYGKIEGRIQNAKQMLENLNCSDFDADFYKNTYKDLVNLDDSQLAFHYVKYGKTEGRMKNVKQMLENVNCNDLDTDFYNKINQINNNDNYSNIFHRYNDCFNLFDIYNVDYLLAGPSSSASLCSRLAILQGWKNRKMNYLRGTPDQTDSR